MVLTRTDLLLEKKIHLSQFIKAGYPIQDNGTFVSIKKVHRVPTFIQHWQLRDLVVSAGNNNIIHTRRNSIYMYDKQTGLDTRYHDGLSFTPTAIHSRYGYVALGGQTGMLMIKDLETGWTKIWSVGRGINNSVCLSKKNDKTYMTVCNNDQTVSIFSIPEMEKIQTLKMPSAINHISVSPDNEKVLLSSDQGIVYLCTINKDGYYTSHLEYKVSEEPSLSCAWNQSSDTFAVSSQDGYVSVYNMHSMQRLCQLGSSETRKTKKAPRSIKFSSGPIDLLAYTEHVSNIYIVDTRTYETRQIVRLSPENEDHAITGFTFSPNSRSIFVGLEDRMVELEIDVSSRRRFGYGQLV